MKKLNTITLNDILGRISESTYKKYIIVIQNNYCTILNKKDRSYRYSFILHSYNMGKIKHEIKDIINACLLGIKD